MTPRIAPLPRTGNPEAVQELIDPVTVGPAANIFLTLANHPGLFRRWLPFGGKLLMGGKLPVRERELVVLRTARRCGSDYEWGQHVSMGRDAGLSDDEIRAVRQLDADLSAGSWSDAERAALQATDELVADHRIADATWQALSADHDTEQLIELCMLAGHYAMLAGVLNSAGVEREDGVGGFETP
jgi:alkylhydroperoxidase family enzyme